MLKVKQRKSLKIRSIMHEYASEFTSTPKGELVWKFAWWKVTKGLWWKHTAAVQSINEFRFMKMKVARHLQNMPQQILHIKVKNWVASTVAWWCMFLMPVS